MMSNRGGGGTSREAGGAGACDELDLRRRSLCLKLLTSIKASIYVYLPTLEEQTMRSTIQAGAAVAVMLLVAVSAGAAETRKGEGTEEFGLSPKQLVEAVEKVEGLISKCMRDQGFAYIAVDYNTVRKGMAADKRLPGVSEEEFVSKYGFGVATLYTGQPPQLTEGYSPGKVALGERNVENYKKLSATDQIAYNRVLFGENISATFAVGLETENFSMTGGCTRKAIEQVFPPEQVKSTFYNSKDALVNKDPRMKSALGRFAKEMNKAGFKYNHPDEIESDIRERLTALTSGGTILVAKMSAEQRVALKDLQDYERRVAAKNFKLQMEVIEPVEERILEEMFARKP